MWAPVLLDAGAASSRGTSKKDMTSVAGGMGAGAAAAAAGCDAAGSPPAVSLLELAGSKEDADERGAGRAAS